MPPRLIKSVAAFTRHHRAASARGRMLTVGRTCQLSHARSASAHFVAQSFPL